MIFIEVQLKHLKDKMDYIKKKKKTSEKYFKLKMKNWDGKIKPIDIHGYLVGLIMGLRIKMNKKYHGLIILTGDMGDGKSSLAEGLFGLYNHVSGVENNVNDVQWTTERINDLMDSRDNIDHSIWWDEHIQGGGNRGKNTKGGKKFQMKFITNRWKKNLYIVCIDSIENCPDYIVKYADTWINCEAPGWQRGFFKVTSKKNVIKYCYDMFKYHKKNWASPELKKVIFDCYGKTDDFGGFFIDPKAYADHKSKETMDKEDEEAKDNRIFFEPKHFQWFKRRLTKESWASISKDYPETDKTIKSWVDKIEKYMSESSELVVP